MAPQLIDEAAAVLLEEFPDSTQSHTMMESENKIIRNPKRSAQNGDLMS